MIKISAFCLGLCLLSTLVLGQRNVPLEYQIYDLPLNMVSARRVGEWQSQGMRGYHRVFLVERSRQQPISHDLFIQWICDCDLGQVALMPVMELSGDSRYELTEPEWRMSQGVNLLEFYAENVYLRTKLFVQVQIRDIEDIRVVARRVDNLDPRFREP